MSGFCRGQTVIDPRGPKEDTTAMRDHYRANGASNGGGLTTGSKLRSGITLTFPEGQEPQSGGEGGRGQTPDPFYTTPRRQDEDSLHSGRGSDQRTPRRESGAGGESRPRPGRRPHHNRTGPKPTMPAQNGAPPGMDQGRRQPRVAEASADEEAAQSLSEKMKELKILQGAEQFSTWLVITVMRQWEAEKDMAEEQARQAEAQAQALIEERSRMKAEKEQLQRSHNEMAARLQLLEGIISDSDDQDENPYPHHDGLGDSPDERFPTHVEVLE